MIDVRPAATVDADAIAAIYNHYVETSTATFDTEPRTLVEQRAWMEEHRGPRHPVLVAEEAGRIVGWASLSPLSAKPAYEPTVEVSVYVADEQRGRGIGRALLAQVLEAGLRGGAHSVIARVAADNEASLRLFAAAGFERVGVEREVGFKFGRFVDVAVLQKLWPGGGADAAR